MKKKRALVVCPGRGSYNKDSLRSFDKYLSNPHFSEFIAEIDQKRRELDQPTLSALDRAEIFKAALHSKGENASALIYACSYGDFLSIPEEEVEIVAITGNSMGWYLALAFAQALNLQDAFTLVNTMGSMMKDHLIGGQIIYPLINNQWEIVPENRKKTEAIILAIQKRPHHELYPSIYLGGYLVLGGNTLGLNAALKELPPLENYPFQLLYHAAFHTPLLNSVSELAFEKLEQKLFTSPKYPLIDGRGYIWQTYSTSIQKLYQYTLGTQVTQTYDFTKAIEVGLKEFAPDQLILLGPGNSLGGPVGQILVSMHWNGIRSKQDFTQMQNENPFVLSMGKKS
ncbi:MAG: hypothetical protein K1X29_08985 [Bdellovibrionales bacterium]|nr:hypothetical protein [Bdellovibrionales bacterium]